jgi:hypothetical protein
MRAQNKLQHRHCKEHFSQEEIYSYSQYNVFLKQGWKQYAQTYIYDEQRTNPAMLLGKRVALMIEHDEIQNDEVLEHLRVWLPHYNHSEYVLKGVFCGVPLIGHIDGFSEPPSLKLGEFKTGRKWTQKMADETDQLTWYALLIHLNFGVKPEDIPMTLTWMPTEWNMGDPIVTGEIINFETRRTMSDVIRVGKKIKDSWEKLGILIAKEYESLGL